MSERNHAAQTRSELTRLIYAQSTPGIVAGLLLTLVMAVVFWGVAPRPVVLELVGALVGANGLRAGLVWVFRRIDGAGRLSAVQIARWRLRYVFVIAMLGLTSGLAVVDLASWGGTPYQVFVLAVICTVAAGNLTTSVAVLPAFGLFQLGLLVPAIVFYGGETTLPRPLALVLLLLLSVLLATGRRLHHTLARSIELGFALEAKNRALEEAAYRAEAAVRAKSTFLAMMSHEIRTPLNAVLGMTSLLSRTELTRDQTEAVETIRTSGDALLALITDILDLSKIEKGKVVAEMHELSVAGVVEDVIRLVTEPVRRKGLELTAIVSRDMPPHVAGDAARLRQVLLNIVSNAVKFTDSGRISVRVSASPSEEGGTVARFTVEDTGLGIPAEARAAMFEPFVQGDQSTTRRHGGTGLGLAIARQLVELMGGSIGLDSEVGRYSRFWFTVPFAAAPPGQRTPSALSGRRVLVSVSSPGVAEMLSALLGEAGAEVLASADGGCDLALFDAGRFESDPGAVRAAADGAALVLLSGGSRDRPPGVAEVLGLPLWPSLVLRQLEAVLASPPRDGREPAPPSLLPRARVLVVEDNPVNQRVAVRMLESLSCDVDVVATGCQALDAAQRTSYHLILMDCQMPDMDGYEATTELRRRETAGARTPIVAMTASALKGDRERCLRSGMDDYVAKPITLGMLQGILLRWVGARGHHPDS